MQAAKNAVSDVIRRRRHRRSGSDHSSNSSISDRSSSASVNSNTSGKIAGPATGVTSPTSTAGTRNMTASERVAKEEVQSFLKNDRKADTEVVEIMKPAITHEHIREEDHELATTVIDKELHQDHYQTRVQPIIDRKVLPEEHKHRTIPVEYREHKHNKGAEIQRQLEEELAAFKSTREILPTTHLVESTNTIVGEHHHHHVYETVQPVIEREIIQPKIIHTTIPVHERIEKEPSFHPKTIQPAITMEEFLKAGGTLQGREARREIFEGEPKVVENGGADITHPNALTSGRPVDSPSIRSEKNSRIFPASGNIASSTRSGTSLTAEERERVRSGGRATTNPLGGSGLSVGRQGTA